MGTAAVEWRGNEFLLLVNRDNWDHLEGEAAAVEGSTLQCSDEMWGGSWLGYKQGRFAFLLDSDNLKHSTTVIPSFFKSTMTPGGFADYLAQKEAKSFGLKLHLVLADIGSGSMVYVSKMPGDEGSLRIIDVAHGVHTISSVNGFDSSSHQDTILRNSIIAMIDIADIEKTEVSIKKIVEDVMMDPPVFINMFDSSGNVVVPRTKHTVGLDVKANRPHAHLYEKRLKSAGNWVNRFRHFDK